MDCSRNCFARETFRRSRRLLAAFPCLLLAIGWIPQAALFCLDGDGAADVLPLPVVAEGIGNQGGQGWLRSRSK
jgi:hypothetical protein